MTPERQYQAAEAAHTVMSRRPFIGTITGAVGAALLLALKGCQKESVQTPAQSPENPEIIKIPKNFSEIQEGESLLGQQLILTLPQQPQGPEGGLMEPETVTFKILQELEKGGQGALFIEDEEGHAHRFVVDKEASKSISYKIDDITMKGGNVELSCSNVASFGCGKCIIEKVEFAELLRGMKHQNVMKSAYLLRYTITEVAGVKIAGWRGEESKEIYVRKLPYLNEQIAQK